MANSSDIVDSFNILDDSYNINLRDCSMLSIAETDLSDSDKSDRQSSNERDFSGKKSHSSSLRDDRNTDMSRESSPHSGNERNISVNKSNYLSLSKDRIENVSSSSSLHLNNEKDVSSKKSHLLSLSDDDITDVSHESSCSLHSIYDRDISDNNSKSLSDDHMPDGSHKKSKSRPIEDFSSGKSDISSSNDDRPTNISRENSNERLNDMITDQKHDESIIIGRRINKKVHVIDSDTDDDDDDDIKIVSSTVNKSFVEHRSQYIDSDDSDNGSKDFSDKDLSLHTIGDVEETITLSDSSNSNDTNIKSQKSNDNSLGNILKDKTNFTKVEFQNQQRKVSSLRVDVEKCSTLLRTMNLKQLPDKGFLLQMRQGNLEKALKEEEEKLEKMVGNYTDDPVESKPKFVPWEQLQSTSSAVVPRTFGRQAMQTLNLQKTLTMDRLKNLHDSLETCPSEDTTVETPNNIKADLMPHQKRALAWLIWRESQKPSGGILADDMGLGKTLTMISLVAKAKEDKLKNTDNNDSDSDTENNSEWKSQKRSLVDGGTLIICPASLLKQWEQEVKKHCKRNALGVELYHGTYRESKPNRLARHDMVVTTYNLAMREYEKKGPLYLIKWQRIILDEAHVVRNHKSQTSLAVCNISGISRWALTGTPVHNKEVDLFALLKFLRCSPFNDLQVWKRWIDNKGMGGQDRLNTVMATIMLRRTKEQLQQQGALKSLPQKTYKLIQIDLDKHEKQIYQKVLIFSRTLFAQFLHQRIDKNADYNYGQTRPGTRPHENAEYQEMHKRILKLHGNYDVKSHQILVLLLRLRQICCHPSLITSMLSEEDCKTGGIENDGIEIDILEKLGKLNLDSADSENTPEDESISNASNKLMSTSNPVFKRKRVNGKISTVLKLIQEEVLPNNDKIIIISQWTSMLLLIKEHIMMAGLECDTLDGSVPIDKRNNIVVNFNNPSHSNKILLLSLTAGGVGLNLVGANHLIFVDVHWNPQLESQAQDRIYRLGQTKPVTIYKIVTNETIEERIKALQDFKLSLANDILSGTKTRTNSKLSIDDLKMLFSIEKI